MPRSFFFHTLAITLMVMLAACADQPAGAGPRFNLVSDNYAYKVGQQTATEAIQTIGVYTEKPQLTQYLEDLNLRLQNVADYKPQIPTQLIMLDSEEVNAWATPGYMNVYRGLLPYLGSEAELASVMGHEQGHNQARHVAGKITKGMVANVLLTGAAIYLGTQSNDDFLNRAVMQVGAFGAGVALAGYGRADEFEADNLGLTYMTRAGYDPREAINSMRAIAATTRYAGLINQALTGKPLQDEGRYSILASHPPTAVRITRMVSSTGGVPDGSVRLPQGITPATAAADPQGRARYLRMIDGLALGPSPSQVVIGRDYVAVPKAGALIYLPDGLVGQVADNHIELANPTGDIKAAIWLIKNAGHNNPCTELQSKADFDVSNLSLIKTANATGCTGVMQAGTGRLGRVTAIPMPGRGRMAIVAFNVPNPMPTGLEQQAMQALVRSRDLTRAEIQALQPLRLSVRTARRGDSVASASRLLPQGALQEEWFRALNGLSPGQELQVGQLYKTVVDPNPF